MNSERNIEVNINPNGIGSIRSDRTRLKIILNNIISNAFKYSRAQINNSFINISFEAITKHIIIKIRDNGVGIEPDRIKKIFEMFYRASEEQSGSGLGLYIAFESAEKLNGRIEVSSAVNQGSTFTITIPKL
jgi:signal transduction histidine kinase